MEDDRVAVLEAQLSQAKLIAEEADKKYEEVYTNIYNTISSLLFRVRVLGLSGLINNYDFLSTRLGKHLGNALYLLRYYKFTILTLKVDVSSCIKSY